MEDDFACKAALRKSPSRRNCLSEAKKVSCSERADEQYVVLEQPARHAKSHWGVSYAVEHRPSRSEERRYERKGRLGHSPRHLRSPSASRWFAACMSTLAVPRLFTFTLRLSTLIPSIGTTPSGSTVITTWTSTILLQIVAAPTEGAESWLSADLQSSIPESRPDVRSDLFDFQILSEHLDVAPQL